MATAGLSMEQGLAPGNKAPVASPHLPCGPQQVGLQGVKGDAQRNLKELLGDTMTRGERGILNLSLLNI